MPSLYLMENIESTGSFTDHLDCFIFCGGNDERFYGVIDNLRENQITIKKSYVFEYCQYRQLNAAGKSRIQSYGTSLLSVAHNKAFAALLDGLKVDNQDTIGIDITGFETPDLLALLYYLKSYYPQASYFFFYAEPYHYHYDTSLFDDIELRKGAKRIEYIPGYVNPGVGTSDTLVVFLGFEKHTPQYVNEQVEPRETYAIYGAPSYLPKLKDVPLANNYDFVSAINMQEHKIAISANNPFDSYNALESIKNAVGEESIISICPLGTHPMSLGAGLFAIDNAKRTKIIYPYCDSSTLYPAKGTSNIWVYKPELYCGQEKINPGNNAGF